MILPQLFIGCNGVSQNSHSGKERQAGYRYDLSILQAEFSLTQIWDRAVSARCYFEEIIRENIDLGRPEHYKDTHSKQYLKAASTGARVRTGLRTETTVNNTYDFGIGRRSMQLGCLAADRL